MGKTEWVKHALNDGKDKFVYLLITWQEEKPLCAGLQQEAIRALGRPLPGSIGNFLEAFFAKNPNLRSRQASFAGFSISDM